MTAQCKHFVTRKKRYCRMTLKRGEVYCGEHIPQTATVKDDDSNPRIACPLDPKHTCFANKLAKHLKICNAKQAAPLPYIEKCVNAGEQTSSKNRSLSSVSEPALQEIISKINKIHNDIIKDSIKEKFATHSLLEQELNNATYGNLTRKHLSQTSAILGLLSDHKLLKPDTCYVEFGAGKGKLSYWISKSLEELNYLTSSVLLIERASHRHKYDNKLDKSSGRVARIRADIADLVLAKVDVVDKAKHVVGVTKHLCGEATDLALRCLINCSKDISGLLMTFCCHHRCQWSNYCGKVFFEENGLNSSDFDIMCGLVSWAVCGTGKSRESSFDLKHSVNEYQSDSTGSKIGLTRQEKEEVGKKCKDLLNYGRKMYLNNYGFDSLLCYYVTRDVTLENVCILAIGDK